MKQEIDMEEIIADDEEMDDEEALLSVITGYGATFRPRMPAMRSCDCGKKLDELICLVKEIQAELKT